MKKIKAKEIYKPAALLTEMTVLFFVHFMLTTGISLKGKPLKSLLGVFSSGNIPSLKSV